MQSEYVLLKELRPFTRRNWKILVQIKTLWEVYQLGIDNSTSLAMIFIDKEGGMIHATVPSDQYDKYKEQLQEEQAISLSNFAVESKDKTYCPINKLFKIKFRPNTIIHNEDHAGNFPEQTFSFTNFNDLEDKVGKTTLLLDVAGLLTKVENRASKHQTRAGEYEKQDIYIRNESGDEIRITFWGKSRNLLTPLIEVPVEETVIVATSLVAKRYDDNIYLQATYGTKIYINFNIPQASALKNSPKKASSKKRLIEEDKKLDEIIALAKESKKAFRASCIATICKVYLDESFYYDACITCKAGVSADFEQYWCYNCKKLMDQPFPRLRIKFQIQDETGAKDVTAFEEVATDLSGKSLDDFMNLSVEFAGHIAVKDALEEILGKKLKFEIKVAKFNLQRPDFPFTVSNLYDWAEPDNKKIKEEENP